MNNTTNTKIIVIVGETASGKSAVGIEIAQKYKGEIICADSRTAYKSMDIGTAKPTQAEQKLIPHYGINLVTPDKSYTAAQFKAYAQTCIINILERGKVPILVGGTGLYIDAVLYDYQFRPLPDTEQRAAYSAMTVQQLQQLITARQLTMPTNSLNPRHLIRTLESDGVEPERHELRKNTLILGLKPDRDVLRQRIQDRVQTMIMAGFVDEVKNVADTYGWDCRALQAPGYKAFKKYVQGSETLQEATDAFVRNDMDLAKRQRTWFKRNKSIHWLSTDDTLAEAVDLTTTFLSK